MEKDNNITANKYLLITVYFIGCILSSIVGYRVAKEVYKQPEIIVTPNSPLIKAYKDSINDMRKQAKLDTEIKESEVREDSIINWRPIERKAIKSDTGRTNKIKRFMEINYRK